MPFRAVMQAVADFTAVNRDELTVKEHQPRAYTIMPMVWCIGSIIGPAIGGALARPCISYPQFFAKGTIWDRFPYLLPNLFSAATVFIGVIVGLLFLQHCAPFSLSRGLVTRPASLPTRQERARGPRDLGSAFPASGDREFLR